MAHSLKSLHDEERLEVLRLFNYRCIRCQAYTETVHEMIPRSSGKIAYAVDNRVPLCLDCHTWAHQISAKESAPILRELRKERLTRCQNANF
jgi:hypothetical protein